jgi:hypothetical protein
MRAICILIAIIAVVMANSRADTVSQIKSNLERLQAASNDEPRGGEENVEQLAIETQRLIQIYVREADQNDWATPSPERLKRLGQVADVLQPYVPLLVDLGTPSGAEQGSQNALNLLYFARPTEELKKKLLDLANVKSPRGAAKMAYGIIVNLGMDTPDVREEIVKRMSEFQDSYKSPAAAEIYAGAKEWRIEEAVPFYVELLQREYRNNEELNWRVRSVAESVRGLGPQAAAVLPLLQQQLARMKAENADFRDINVIEGAIRAVEGKEPIEPLLSVSGAGPVGENPLPKSSTPTPLGAAPSTPISPMATPVQQPKSTAQATPSPTAAETMSAPSGFPIVPVAILAALIVGIVLYLLRRKST